MSSSTRAASQSTPLERMQWIHRALAAGEFPSSTALAKALRVASTTIRRDLDFMRRRLALPIEFVRSERGYGYSQSVEGLASPRSPKHQARNKPSIFISYSHKDARFRDELRGALAAHELAGEIKLWDDTCIIPGQRWEQSILRKLETADIVIFLLSNDFIRSDYCTQKEMKRALERDADGECAILSVVIRACPFTKLELGQIQAIVPHGKPVIEHRHRDSAWYEVSKQLDRVLKRFNERRE